MRNRLGSYVAAAGVALLASTASAQAQSTEQAFPKPVDSGGTARSVAASNGTAAWLSQEKRPGSRGGFSLHILKRGETQATKIAVKSKAILSELAIESAGDDITVVAVASKNLRALGDIVSINPTSGAVRKVRGASRAAIREHAPALADGTLSFATPIKGRVFIKQVPAEGGKVTTFATLPAKYSSLIDMVAYPGEKRLGVQTHTLKKRTTRVAFSTVTKGGRPRVIKAQSFGPSGNSFGVGGPYVTDGGKTLFAMGLNGRLSLYRAGDSRPVREMPFYQDAAWVGGDLGLLAIVFDGTNNLRGTGPIG